MNCLYSSSAGSGSGAGAEPGIGAGQGAGAGVGSGPREVVPGGTIPDSKRCSAESAAEPRLWRRSGAILNKTESDGEAESEFPCLLNGLAEPLVELLEM